MALVIDAEADDLVLSNNDPVASWPGGGGNDFAQATSGNRPIYRTNAVNSLPAVQFAVTGGKFMANSYSPTGDLTAYIVAKFSSLPAFLGMLCSCHSADTGAGADGGFWFGFYTAGSSLGMNSGVGGSWVSGVNITSGFTTGFDTDWHLWTIRIQSGSTRLWCDNVLVFDNAAGTIATGNPLWIGSDVNSGSGSYFDGFISKVAWYDDANDDSTIDSTNLAIIAKYDLPNSDSPPAGSSVPVMLHHLRQQGICA